MIWHFEVTFEADSTAEVLRELQARILEMAAEIANGKFSPPSHGMFYTER